MNSSVLAGGEFQSGSLLNTGPFLRVREKGKWKQWRRWASCTVCVRGKWLFWRWTLHTGGGLRHPWRPFFPPCAPPPQSWDGLSQSQSPTSLWPPDGPGHIPTAHPALCTPEPHPILCTSKCLFLLLWVNRFGPHDENGYTARSRKINKAACPERNGDISRFPMWVQLEVQVVFTRPGRNHKIILWTKSSFFCNKDSCRSTFVASAFSLRKVTRRVRKFKLKYETEIKSPDVETWPYFFWETVAVNVFLWNLTLETVIYLVSQK